MYKGVIFDLDGTLLDTVKDIADAANTALQNYGLDIQPIDNYKSFIGNGTKNMIRQAVGSNIDETTLESILSCYKDLYEIGYATKTTKYIGIDDVLSMLNAHNIPISVLSNKPNNIAVKIIKEYFPDVNFCDVIGQKEGVPIKPDPTVALYMLKRFGYIGRDVALIGDTGVDMDTANAIDVDAVGVLWGYRDKTELMTHSAKLIATCMDDLFKILCS